MRNRCFPTEINNPPVLTFLLQLVQDLLKSLPNLFQKTMETQSALGSALQAAFKLLSPTGGRMSVFQTQLPNLGVGALQSREDPNQRASAKVGAPMTSRILQQHYVVLILKQTYNLNDAYYSSDLAILNKSSACGETLDFWI